MVELNLNREDINRSNNIKEAIKDVDFYDDGHIFVNKEDDFIVSDEESDDSDNEFDDLNYDDDDGPTRCKGIVDVAKDAKTSKLSFVFDSECQLAIYAIVERFNNECRYIIRTHRSFHYKDWRHVPKEIGGEHDLAKAKLSRHDEVKEQVDWEYLCDLWSSTTFVDRMLEWRSQNTPEEMSDKEIMERVLGHHFVRLRGWARFSSTSTQTDASDSTDRRPSYEELLVELATIRYRLKEIEVGFDECRQVLRSQGLTLAPSNPDPISDRTLDLPYNHTLGFI
ncbi:hypothetical protein PanWU01x14_276800 [Parasponia andersonii]|uniref:Uncharacterized protein n=1 Tax=Parasponia andersonii TaxID=3476 RepID=A0A2P5B2J4_PARAD|nr:hypothetical protein PanWU01x14_276800 [Parasponia andersonii]